MESIRISIRCFGIFRQFGDVIDVDVNTDSSVGVIKSILVDYLGEKHRDIVAHSVLANDSGILPIEYIVDAPMELSILPPVCGG